MQRKHKRTINYKEKGITLIALVVTIIVLLILAGITIQMVLGENGIIQRAKDSTEIYARAEQNEQNSFDYFDEEIGKYTGGNSGGGSGGGNTGTALKIGGTDLSTVSDLSTLYGQTVSGFSANSTTQAALDTEGITWQLFYDDAENYYLITSDYVPGSTLPSELLTDGQYTTYCRKYETSLSWATSPITCGEEWSKASSASTVQNNPYLKWVGSSYDNKNNKYINMKAVAYMMDTDVWSDFAGGVGTAIGGPTIEMLSLSWNAVSGHTQMTSYAALSDSNANGNGYIAGGPEWDSDFFGTATNMWFIKEYNKAYGMWLASPSSSMYTDLRSVYYWGKIFYGEVYYGGFGFRPVVSIPKS